MITLTNPAIIQSILGGNAPIDYDKLVASHLHFDIFNKTINGDLRLTSISNPEMQAFIGAFSISHGNAELLVQFTQGVQFTKRIVLSAGNLTAIQNILNEAQADIENGLISLNIVAGVRSVGI